MGWTVVFPAFMTLWSVVFGGIVGVYWKQIDSDDRPVSRAYVSGVGFVPLPLIPIGLAVKWAETKDQYLIIAVVTIWALVCYCFGQWLTVSSPLKDFFKG